MLEPSEAICSTKMIGRRLIKIERQLPLSEAMGL